MFSSTIGSRAYSQKVPINVIILVLTTQLKS